MRLANLTAFQRYAANLERHNIPVDDRVKRLMNAINQSEMFLSSREYGRCEAFVANYASERV